MRAAAKWVQPEHHQIVGATLMAARRHANLTQVELAARLGKPQSFVSAYEVGKRRVDVSRHSLMHVIRGKIGATSWWVDQRGLRLRNRPIIGYCAASHARSRGRNRDAILYRGEVGRCSDREIVSTRRASA
jgi:DNA-binding transcriptional regulator YiaG